MKLKPILSRVWSDPDLEKDHRADLHLVLDKNHKVVMGLDQDHGADLHGADLHLVLDKNHGVIMGLDQDHGADLHGADLHLVLDKNHGVVILLSPHISPNPSFPVGVIVGR